LITAFSIWPSISPAAFKSAAVTFKRFANDVLFRTASVINDLREM